MKDSTIEILSLLAYGLNLLSIPTLHNWNRSYDGWLNSHGFSRRLRHLESRQLVTRERKSGAWVYQLTQAGRKLVDRGRNPKMLWQRKWDGWWRQLVFDLPINQQSARISLLRWLRRNGFGYLQDSVWISPDPVKEIARAVKTFRDDAESFTILECRCAPGFSNGSLVRAAWPFAQINKSYQAYQQFIATTLKRLQTGKLHPRDLFTILRTENKHWTEAFDRDPLLPSKLWPHDYAGHQAWEARQHFFGLAAYQVSTE